jgi:hypothetical protein
MVDITLLEKPRLPNEEEIKALVLLEVEKYGQVEPDAEDVESVEDFLQNSAIAAVDKYATDGPGYGGKIIEDVPCIVYGE